MQPIVCPECGEELSSDEHKDAAAINGSCPDCGVDLPADVVQALQELS